MDLSGIPPHRTETTFNGEPSRDEKRLREAAVQLEASFLSEMLKYAGVGKVSEFFGGGEGEEQFTSMLRDAQAMEIASRGGIGLAEMLFESLKEQVHDN